MTIRNKVGVFGATLLAPVVLWAFSSGPDAGSAGVPTEGSCIRAGCHTAGATGSGSVSISAAGGNTYQPGVAKMITVVVSQATAYGFQATIRPEGSPKGNGGTLRATQAGTFVYCASTDLLAQTEKASGGTCAANRPLEYVQHSRAASDPSFTFEWTPPAGATGNLIVYAAGNAANGNGSNSGDRVYLANLTLTPGASPTRPSLSSNDTQVAGDFGGAKTLAPGSWVEIKGTALSTTTREWAGSDFTNGGLNAPTTLDGVSVTVDGRNAFVRFVSPAQVNIQVPDGIGTGSSIPVVLRNANGASDPITMSGAARTPLFLAPGSFRIGGRQYLAALFADRFFVGRANLIQGVAFRPARPGDRILLFAIGCGPVTPAQQSGVVTTVANSLPDVRILFGGTQATLEYQGLAPQALGLYQFNVIVPNVADGDAEITGSVGGVNFQSGTFLTIQR